MGAMMNESFQAKEGLPPDLFPEDVPTYTGHYHKPHTVADTNIRYIGSPYQGTCYVCQRLDGRLSSHRGIMTGG